MVYGSHPDKSESGMSKYSPNPYLQSNSGSVKRRYVLMHQAQKRSEDNYDGVRLPRLNSVNKYGNENSIIG